jgi:hypothetical protein
MPSVCVCVCVCVRPAFSKETFSEEGLPRKPEGKGHVPPLTPCTLTPQFLTDIERALCNRFIMNSISVCIGVKGSLTVLL